MTTGSFLQQAWELILANDGPSGESTPPIHGSGVLKVEDFRMISVYFSNL